MDTHLASQLKELLEAVHYRPAISLIMPFEPKMKDKSELTKRLKFAYDQIKKEVQHNYNDELAELVLSKLRKQVENINYSTFKKTVALFVSPVFEKVLYLDIPVEEKIIIDESFEIRDLVLAKKEEKQFLLVSVTAKATKIYLVDQGRFTIIKVDVAEYAKTMKYDLPERVANFSDPAQQKEFNLKKFLHYSDKGLHGLLKSYPLPVLVMGSQKVLGYFKSLTRNIKNIVGYIPGNYSELPSAELAKIIEPAILDWKKIQMKLIFQKMEDAAGAGKLVSGIKEVWKQVNNSRGKLLIVEKNFRVSAEQGSDKSEILELSKPYNDFSYIRDAVDDMIEKMLEMGADVEFVETDTLKEYGRIVLIQYY